MKSKLIQIFSIIIFTIANILIGGNEAFAIKTITMSPMSQKVILIPGEQYEGAVTIANPSNSTENLDYIASIGSYSIHSNQYSKDDYGDMDYRTKTSYNIIMDWTTINNPTGTVAPGATEKISFIIDVPQNAPAGGQYMSILVSENKNNDTAEGGIGVVELMQMAHTVYAEVAGETNEKGLITENSIPAFLTSNKLETTSIVKNEGNVHTEAQYILQVWPVFSSEEICTNEEDPNTSLVLPDTERYHTESCSLPPIGIFTARQTIKIFGEESVVEKMIIVCPIWLLFIIIFVIVALIIWIILRAKNRGSKRRAEA